LTIEFLDAHGINISKDAERKIENTYIQEDFRRVEAANMGEAKYIPQLAEAYREGLMKVVEAAALKRCRSRILVAYDFQNLNWFIPSLLEKLGGAINTINSAEHSLEETSGLVRSGHMDMGVFLSDNADDIILLTPDGDIINGDKLLTLWAYIMFNQNRTQALGIPITAPSAIESMAAQMGGKVIRTKIHPRSVMEVSRESFFQPLFDGMYVFLKVLEYMQLRDIGISHLLKLVPGSYLYKKDIPCPWAEKGMVMRRLIEDAKDTRVELLDGIKVFTEEGWILILPDCEEPIFKIVSEAGSQEAAENLANRYIKKIEQYKTAI
jgi:mannose-1-phosphate guanylyltransferase/phosphomannomutase